MALTSDEAIVAYLKRRDIPFTEVEALSGGYSNYVWRITGVPDPDSSLPGIKILKHAEPVLKAYASLPFTVERMDFEAKALNLVSNTALAVPKKGSVNAPKLFWYDDEAHVMCISEGGSRNLKSAYSDSSVDVVSAGKILGEWLATFHAMGTGKGESTKHLLASFDNALAKSMSRHSYSNLAATVEETGLGLKEIQLARRIDEDFGSLLQVDDECLCHGDFWPGNVLVGDSEQLVLTVVDWEMVRRGCSATDVGQFAAEAWLLDKFRGGRGLCKAFVESYAASSQRFDLRGSSTEQAEGWSCRFAIHLAVHLAFWPAHVPWASAEGTKSFAQWALDLAQAVVSGDLDKIRSETVGGDFNPASVFLKS